MTAACSAKCKIAFLLIFLLTLSLFSRPVVYAGSPKPVKVYASIFDVLKAIWDAITGGFQNVMESVQNVTQTIWNTLYETFRHTIDTALSLMQNLWNGVVNVARFIGDAVITAGKVFVDTVAKFLGNWGDPALYQFLSLKALSDPLARHALANPNDYTVDAVLENGDPRLVSEVVPSGFLGFISYAVFAVHEAWPIIELALQNIVFIHLAVIVGLLVYGLYASVQKRDIEPMVQAFHWIYSIFAFYGRAITWIISRAIDLVQAIGQWLDTVIPL